MTASPDTMKKIRQRRMRERATIGILPYEANYDEHLPVNACPARNVVFDFGGVLVRWQPEAVIAGFYADIPRARSCATPSSAIRTGSISIAAP